MICYVLAMGKQHLGPHVVVGYGIKIFGSGLFITSPDHLDMAPSCNRTRVTLASGEPSQYGAIPDSYQQFSLLFSLHLLILIF